MKRWGLVLALGCCLLAGEVRGQTGVLVTGAQITRGMTSQSNFDLNVVVTNVAPHFNLHNAQILRFVRNELSAGLSEAATNIAPRITLYSPQIARRLRLDTRPTLPEALMQALNTVPHYRIYLPVLRR